MSGEDKPTGRIAPGNRIGEAHDASDALAPGQSEHLAEEPALSVSGCAVCQHEPAKLERLCEGLQFGKGAGESFPADRDAQDGDTEQSTATIPESVSKAACNVARSEVIALHVRLRRPVVDRCGFVLRGVKPAFGSVPPARLSVSPSLTPVARG